jgi:hypothetical protein
MVQLYSIVTARHSGEHCLAFVAYALIYARRAGGRK